MEDRIRQVIEFYGITPNMLERKIFVSEGTIYKFLSGKIGMKVTTLVKILENFPNISPDWLLLGKGEMLRQNCQNHTQASGDGMPTRTCPEVAPKLPRSCPEATAHLDGVSAEENRMLRANNDALLKHIGLLEAEISRLELQLSTERKKTNSSSAPTPMEPISA